MAIMMRGYTPIYLHNSKNDPSYEHFKNKHHNRKTVDHIAHQRVYVYAPDSVVGTAPPHRFSKTTKQFVQDGLGFAWDILS